MQQRCTNGTLAPWAPDEQGRLWSAVLNLYLVIQGTLVQAQTRSGRMLLTPEQEAEARRWAEEEAEHLRLELQQYRSGGTSS